MGERAIRWVDAYLTKSRPKLIVPPDDGALFISHLGDCRSPRVA